MLRQSPIVKTLFLPGNIVYGQILRMHLKFQIPMGKKPFFQLALEQEIIASPFGKLANLMFGFCQKNLQNL